MSDVELSASTVLMPDDPQAEKLAYSSSHSVVVVVVVLVVVVVVDVVYVDVVKVVVVGGSVGSSSLGLVNILGEVVPLVLSGRLVVVTVVDVVDVVVSVV